MTNHAASLLAAQNSDGGWAYVRGSSWTEPTACALLALKAWGQEGNFYLRGLRWLRAMQQPDGGFKPQPGVGRSTWVTALAFLVCAGTSEAGESGAALRWLLSSEGRTSRWVERLRARLLGREVERGAGWPFFPDTAAWVAPTALSLIALAAANRKLQDPHIAARLAAGREFLMSRQCADGGWNHGSSRALGYESGSYPETTGLALLALRDIRSAAVERSLGVAQRHLTQCHSPEGCAWLELALRAHGRPVPPVTEPACHTTVDHALLALSQAAAEGRSGALGI